MRDDMLARVAGCRLASVFKLHVRSGEGVQRSVGGCDYHLEDGQRQFIYLETPESESKGEVLTAGRCRSRKAYLASGLQGPIFKRW
jgi:hypothetical protein